MQRGSHISDNQEGYCSGKNRPYETAAPPGSVYIKNCRLITRGNPDSHGAGTLDNSKDVSSALQCTSGKIRLRKLWHCMDSSFYGGDGLPRPHLTSRYPNMTRRSTSGWENLCLDWVTYPKFEDGRYSVSRRLVTHCELMGLISKARGGDRLTI